MCLLSVGVEGKLHKWDVNYTPASNSNLWDLLFGSRNGNCRFCACGARFSFVCLFKGVWIKWRIGPSCPYHCGVWPFLYFPRANSTGKFVMYKEHFSFLLPSVLTSFLFSASSSLPLSGNCQFYFAHGNSHVLLSLHISQNNARCIISCERSAFLLWL